MRLEKGFKTLTALVAQLYERCIENERNSCAHSNKSFENGEFWEKKMRFYLIYKKKYSFFTVLKTLLSIDFNF